MYLLAMFFISGFTALIYQVLWQRVLTYQLGADSYSATFIVAIFIMGLTLGSFIGSKLNFNNLKALMLVYVCLELCIGIYGYFSISILESVEYFLYINNVESLYSKLLLYFLALVAPTAMMGITSPLVMQLCQSKDSVIGQKIGFFYGANILGATLGALFAGLFMIEIFGIRASAFIAALCNFILSFGGIYIFTHYRLKNYVQPIKIKLKKRILFAALLLGVSTIGCEMVFFRVMQNYLTLSPFSFTITLAVFLVYMSIGQYFGGYLSDKYIMKLPQTLMLCITAATILFCISFNMPPYLFAIIKLMPFSTFSSQLIEFSHIKNPSFIGAILISMIMMIGVIPWTAMFPIVIRMQTNKKEHAGECFAVVYSLFSIGNVLGVLFAGLFLFGSIGTILTLKILIIIATLTAFLLAIKDAKHLRISQYCAFLLCQLMLIICIPNNFFYNFSMSKYKISQIIEGDVGIVSVVPTQRFYSIIDMFRTASASAIVKKPAKNEEYEAYRWNLSDLMMIDKDFRPERILIIGLGHGYLPLSLLDYPFVKEIVVVDISQEIIDAVKLHSIPEIQRIFNDPRIKIVKGDGRTYIKSYRGENFDLIQNKINEPWTSGSSTLFTTESFKEIYNILNDNGYYATRPHEPHLKNGLNIFPRAIFTGYYHVYFSKKISPISGVLGGDAMIKNNFARLFPGENKYDEKRLVNQNINYEEYFKQDINSADNFPINTDDHPIYEFNLVSRLLDKQLLWNYIKFNDPKNAKIPN